MVDKFLLSLCLFFLWQGPAAGADAESLGTAQGGGRTEVQPGQQQDGPSAQAADDHSRFGNGVAA